MEGKQDNESIDGIHKKNNNTMERERKENEKIRAMKEVCKRKKCLKVNEMKTQRESNKRKQRKK